MERKYFPAVMRDALAGEDVWVTPGGKLLVIPLPQLIALRLYAGGSKAKSDIVELLRRNPEADPGVIQQICRRYRLRGLGALLRELDFPTAQGDADHGQRLAEEGAGNFPAGRVAGPFVIDEVVGLREGRQEHGSFRENGLAAGEQIDFDEVDFLIRHPDW